MADRSAPLMILNDCRIASFRVPARRAVLQGLVDRSMNAAREASEQLVVDDSAVWVHAALLEGGRLSQAGPCHVVFLGVPVRRAAVPGDRPVLFCPYLFVSESHDALPRFREVLGYPAWGADIVVTGGAGTCSLSVRTEVFRPGDPAPHPETEVLAISWQWPDPGTARSVIGEQHTSQLLQVRETTSPHLALLREPVRLVWTGEVAGMPASAPATVRVVGGFRNLDLTGDLGLASGDISLPAESCAFGTADVLQCDFAKAERTRGRVLPRATSFVEARLDPRAPPPYAFDDVSITGFLVTADESRLRFLVDALLNSQERLGEPRQYFRYVPATREVVVELIDYGKLRSVAPATPWRTPEDYTSQRELAIRFLVGKAEEDSDVAVEPRVFCPFLFVDNWASMITGREILGLWKRMASFRRTTRHGDDEGILGREVRADGESVFSCEHLQQPDAMERALGLQELRGSRARGALPWQQRHFAGRHFRNTFAREWFAVGRQEYGMIQRRICPWPLGAAPLRQWVEMLYRIRDFRVAMPRGSVKLGFGRFKDPELASLLAITADAMGMPEVPGVDADTGTIDVAGLLGIGVPEPLLPTSDWYLARGSFDLEVVDRFA